MSDINNHHSAEQDFLDDVQRRAAVDREFRDQLLNDPGPILAELVGQEIPRDFTIRFIEKDKGTDALVVLPDMVPETMELSEAQLEAVAGGAGGPDICWWTCVGTDIDTEEPEPEPTPKPCPS